MIVVAPATPGDLAAAAAVLAEAFAGDPVVGTVVGGPERGREERTRHFFVGLLRPAIADGTVDVARQAGRTDVLGVAIWEAPDAVTTVGRLTLQLPSFWRACGVRGLRRAITTKQVIDRHRPRARHWYLQEIGVAAAARGQGVGGALLESRLAGIDHDDVGAYLESSGERSRRLYRRHGFVDAGPVEGLAVAPVAMWRAPASGRRAPAAPAVV